MFAPFESLWKSLFAVSIGALKLNFSVATLTVGSYFMALDMPTQKLSRVATALQQLPGADLVRLLAPPSLEALWGS